jgi:hypothetical protein
MKITIDTKEDSHDDIRKVMQILNHFSSDYGSSPVLPNESNEARTAPVDTTNMMNMFGSASTAEPSPTNDVVVNEGAQDSDFVPDLSKILNPANHESIEESEPEPKVELF